MRSAATLLAAGLLAVAVSGCAAPGPAGRADTPAQQAQRELDECRQALRAEQAQTATLTVQLQTTQRLGAALETERAALQARLEQLQQQYDELRAATEQRVVQPLERPAAPASPLPPELDHALLQFAERLAGRVGYDRGRAAVTFANDLLFDSGSDEVRRDAVAAIGELAAVTSSPSAAGFDVIVVGHTDDMPIRGGPTAARHPTNWHLSVHRAIAVKNVLVQAGLSEDRVGVMGYAEQRPLGIDPARNRRVEIFLVPRGEVQSFAPVRPPRR